MVKILLNGMILLLLTLVIWLVIDQKYQQKINRLQKEISIYKELQKEKKESSLTLSDVSFILNKDKELSTVKKGLLFFSSKSEKLSPNKWKISVLLNGDADSAADAADLMIDIPNNFSVSDLNVGASFPIYPRKVIEKNYILVTGIASAVNNEVVLGKPNNIFVDFIVESTQKSRNNQITINQAGTKIYLNGESVLDSSKTANFIELL